MALTPIRPNAAPPTPAAQPAAEAARTAAQRAFFDAALGRAGSPQPARATGPTGSTAFAPSQATAAASRARLPDPTAEAPQKILRPGSLLDIRV